MSVDFPGKYNSWDRVEPSELFSCPTEKKEASAGMKMEAYLASEAKNCTMLVLWLDCDKEVCLVWHVKSVWLSNWGSHRARTSASR